MRTYARELLREQIANHHGADRGYGAETATIINHRNHEGERAEIAAHPQGFGTQHADRILVERTAGAVPTDV